MSKKVKIVIAVIAAILIIVVVALCAGGNDKKGGDKTFGDTKHNSKVEKNVDDAEVTGGVEDSIFDEDGSDGEASSGSSGDGNKSSSDNNKSSSSSSKNESSKNDSSSSDKNSSSSNKNEQSSTAKPGEMDYETFHAMSPSDQQAYMESFDDVDKFFKWYNKAKAQYEKENPAIEVDGKKPVELK